jgi:hypothetical protein
MKNRCDCGFTTYCDCYVEDSKPNESLKSAKKKHNKALIKTRSIGPTVIDSTYEYDSDWDETLTDGIEYENWDELYEDYVGEEDIYEFVQWLKDNFQVPNKLGSQDL